jgi:hypothetical protein
MAWAEIDVNEEIIKTKMNAPPLLEWNLPMTKISGWGRDSL